jgi:uncharacterized protein YoxC
MAKTATRQVSIFLNGQQVETTVKNITSAMKETSNRLAKMVVGSDEYIQQLEEVKRLKGMLIEHNTALNGVSKGWNLMKGGVDKYIGIAAGAFAVDNILSAGKALFTTGAQMEALTKKAKTVFGEALPQITAEAEKNATAMGLTTQQYIAAAAAAQDLLVPMGFQRKEAADISAQLVNLSGALSEWTGGTKTATEVNDILTKALLGEREELKSLGISISEADVKSQLAAKGADKLTGSALEQAKAMATLELVLAKSTDAQAQFATEADSSVRRQAEATAKLAQIGEKLAAIFLPIFNTLLDIGTGVLDLVGDLVGGLEATVQPAEAASKAFAEQAKTVAMLENDIAPLLDRYDELTSKSTLTADEQNELRGIIDKVSAAIPGAVSGFNEYGVALGLNTDAAREFIEVEKARLAFVNQEAINQYKKTADEYRKMAENQGKTIDGLRKNYEQFKNTAAPEDLAAVSTEIQRRSEELKNLNVLLAGANAEVDRLSGKNLDTPKAAPAAPPTGGGSGGGSGTGKPSAEAEEKAAAAREQAAYERRLLIASEGLAKLRELSTSASEQQQADFEAAQEALFASYVEAKENEKLIDLNYEAEKNAAKEELRVAVLDDKALELETLQAHYDQLLFIAQKYGLDTTALKAKQAEDQAAIEKKYADKALTDQQEAQQARLAGLQSMFTEFGNFVTATFDLLGGEGEKAATFQKVATLAKIAFDTAAAISSLVAASEANPTNAVTFGAAGIAQYVAGFARIISNVAQARKILTSAPAVKQKFIGGLLPVTGATDGRTYNASVMPTPGTGLLPGFPVLFNSNATGAPVLASERGPEYFVASKDLQNPVVASYVRMIDNLTAASHGRVPQFAEGGTTATTPPVATASVDLSVITQNTAVMQELINILRSGIKAVLPDQTIIDANKRFKDINNGSGGYYG